MDLSLERDSSVLGSLFNQIIADMKNTSPLWEDFVAKASKLHASLKAAIQAIAAYLDAFQKIADAATNSKGASKEIGTALTRVCLRHKAVETRLKTFTTAIMDCLVLPLQEKLEDWKRSVATIDKEHAKEHKRCRNELKKRSNDTLRLQKKARKGQSDTIQSLVDSHMQDVTMRRAELEDVEKKSLRSAMVEERTRYCTFVNMLQPVVKEECEVMSELGHLQEAMESIANVTKEPNILPQASEELILDVKSTLTLYPESPGGGSGSQGGCSNSLGSRKSSVCSISSINSSGSSGSPGHNFQRSLSQFVSPAMRLKPGESSDSGFCSSPALTTQVSTTTSQSHVTSTWPPHVQEMIASPTADRPHTISTTYEKGHQRPPLTVYTYQNPETIAEGIGTGNNGNDSGTANLSGQNVPSTQKSISSAHNRPPLPVRCSSLERPLTATNNRNGTAALLQRRCPSPIPAHISKELPSHHMQQQQLQHSPPAYANMAELASMASLKTSNQHSEKQQSHEIHKIPPLQQQQSTESHGSVSSLLSNDSNPQQCSAHSAGTSTATNYTNTPHSHTSSSTPSLHSHPSTDSTVATPLLGHTPTASSGCSTPQNHYSPLLTNTPSSTAAGTPSGSNSFAGNAASTGNLFCNVDSPTLPHSGKTEVSDPATETCKISEVNSIRNVQNNSNPNNENADRMLNQQPRKSTEKDSSTIVENDEHSRASVLQKASMFEKQAAAAATPNQSVSRHSCSVETGTYAFGHRRSEDHRNVTTPITQQKSQSQHATHPEADKSLEDSIQELNNLIGALDSFQRENDKSKQQLQNIEPMLNTTATLTEAATTLLSYQQEQQQPADAAILSKARYQSCSSNPMHSSSLSLDISDLTYEKCIADTRSPGVASIDKTSRSSTSSISRHNQHDLEHSQCHISETSSLVVDGSDGFENPTFAHFTTNKICNKSSSQGDNASVLTVDDGVSQSSETYSLANEERHVYVDNSGDDGSGDTGLVVIYDHHIPLSADIDYMKQNSEIVVLRTKNPQVSTQNVRELQNLPENLSAVTSNNAETAEISETLQKFVPVTATIAPAKQRLSSFRCSSEKQMQTAKNHSPQHQKHEGMQRVSFELRNTVKSPATATMMNILKAASMPIPPTVGSLRHSSPLQQRSSPNTDAASIRNAKVQLQELSKVQNVTVADFKADFNSKICKQKQKLLRLSNSDPEQAHQQHSSIKSCITKKNHETQQQQQSPSNTSCNLDFHKNHTNTSFPPKTASSRTLSPPSSMSSSSKANFTVNTATSVAAANSNGRNNVSFAQVTSLPKLPSFSNEVANTNFSPHLHSKFSIAERILPSTLLSPSDPNSPQTSLSTQALVNNVVFGTSTPNATLADTSSTTPSRPLPSSIRKTPPAIPAPKPLYLPRPASLSTGTTTRIARRSSVNTSKPLPPIRRSSSVTPSPNTSKTEMSPTQQQTAPNTCAESPTYPGSKLLKQKDSSLSANSLENLPPPPAFLLEQESPSQLRPKSPPHVIPTSTQKVAETVKALSVLRHQSASPNVLRRIQGTPPQTNVKALKPFRTSSPGIYAQPKIVSNMLSFRSASPSPNGLTPHQHTYTTNHDLPPAQPKTNPNLIAQLNARLNNKQEAHRHEQPESVYMRNCSTQQQQQQNLDDCTNNVNVDRNNMIVSGAGSIRSKTKAEFLENLNAKLAKQSISGRAFAVRNLINNKALPDPRICHESLMDQIKRGATLKRNQKINDRSAPKIY